MVLQVKVSQLPSVLTNPLLAKIGRVKIKLTMTHARRMTTIPMREPIIPFLAVAIMSSFPAETIYMIAIATIIAIAIAVMRFLRNFTTKFMPMRK